MPVSRWVYSLFGGQPGGFVLPAGQRRGGEGAAVRDGGLGDLDLQRGRVLDVTAVDAVRVDVREVRPVQRVVMQQHVVDGHLQRAAQDRPAGLAQRGQVGRLGPAAQRRIAGPDPDERRPLPDRVAAHLGAVGHVPLGRHADAPAVRREREAVVAAHDLVPVERAHRQRRGAVRAAVVEHRRPGRLPAGTGAADARAPVGRAATGPPRRSSRPHTSSSAGSCRIRPDRPRRTGRQSRQPPELVGVHRSSTSRSDFDRETHTIMYSLASRSSSD